MLDELDGRRGDGRAVPHERRALQRGGAARGARPEPPLRRGAAPADAAGRHPCRAWRRWSPAGSPSCSASSAPSATPWRSCSWGTAPRGTRRAAPPPCSSPRRSGAAGWRARWWPRSSTTIRRSRRSSPGSAQPTVLVVPFLIGGGAHVLEDIPRLVGLAERSRIRAGGTRRPAGSFLIDDAVGTYPGLEEIVVDLARRHTPPPAPRFRPRMVAHVRKEPGPVHLVGGGPGDPGPHHLARPRAPPRRPTSWCTTG